MSICVATGALVTHLAVSAFTLSWVHTVENTQWEEDWRVVGEHLQLISARIKGSGAGMEPPQDAVLKNGWWQYRPKLGGLRALNLADSGMGSSQWRLCADGTCRNVSAENRTTTIVIRPCEPKHVTNDNLMRKD